MNGHEKVLLDNARLYVQSAADPHRREELCTSVISFMLHTLNQRLGLLTPQEQASVVSSMSLTEQLIYRAMQDTLATRLPENSLTSYVHAEDEAPAAERRAEERAKALDSADRKKQHGRSRNGT